MESPQTTTSPSITSILRIISDDKALTLFNTIALSSGVSGYSVSSLKEMELTTKQYYSRMSGLMKADLIKRHKGKYSLTILGKIVFDAHLNIGKALNYYWKFKAIEAIQTSTSASGLRKEDLLKLIDTLIDNHQIKDILTKELEPLENKATATQEIEQAATSGYVKKTLLDTIRELNQPLEVFSKTVWDTNPHRCNRR